MPQLHENSQKKYLFKPSFVPKLFNSFVPKLFKPSFVPKLL
jgi:hypothetical protein